MIVKTEAIVLSKMKFRDTSKILRLYTREFGKMSVLAKGARGARSPFRSALEPMNYVAAVIYKKENRELQLLSQCDVLKSFRHLTEDMEKMSVVMSALELVTIVSHDEERNEPLFLLLRDLLDVVNDETKKPDAALYYFESKLAALLGFRPDLHFCAQCGKKVDEKELAGNTRFSVTDDGVVCAECSELSDAPAISPVAVRIMQRLQEVDSFDAALNIHLTPAVKEEVANALRRHLQRHIEGFRGLRSEEVFADIL